MLLDPKSLVRGNLLGGVGVAVLGKEESKLSKKPLRILADFPKTNPEWVNGCVYMTNNCIFSDGKVKNSKTVECYFGLGMDVSIIQVLEEGEMDILLCGLKLRVKKCQVLATHDKHMFLGAPNCIPTTVVKKNSC